MSLSVRIIKDTEQAGLRKLVQRLRQGTHSVLVGVPEGAKDEDGTPLAQVAAQNEFGTERIPERSFLRAGTRKHLPYFSRLTMGSLRRIARGEIADGTALGILGAAAAGRIQLYIRNGTFTPNAPSTIRAKKSDKPLIDTANLRQSITFQISDAAANARGATR